MIVLDHPAHVIQIVLNQADLLAKELGAGLTSLLVHEQVAITSRET